MDAFSIFMRKMKSFNWRSIINYSLICSHKKFVMLLLKSIKSQKIHFSYRIMLCRIKRLLCLCLGWEGWKRKKDLQFKQKNGVNLLVIWEAFQAFLGKMPARLRTNLNCKPRFLHRKFKLNPQFCVLLQPNNFIQSKISLRQLTVVVNTFLKRQNNQPQFTNQLKYQLYHR